MVQVEEHLWAEFNPQYIKTKNLAQKVITDAPRHTIA
jgi:hypothetical protein